MPDDKITYEQKRAVLSTQAAVVGSLLVDPRICGELFAQTSADDLVTPEYRHIYDAARELFFAGAKVDAVTVLDKLGGGQQVRRFLTELMDVTPTSANWEEYAALLREQARLYRLRQLGEQLAKADSLDAARDLLSKAHDQSRDAGKSNAVSVKEGLMDFMRRQTQPVNYIRFGVTALDKMLFADKGDFIVIGGRPSAGKTLLSIQMAYVLARSYRVGYFSLETGKAKYFDRFFTQACLLDFDHVKRHGLTKEEFETISSMQSRLMDLSVDMIPASGYTVDDIQAETLANRYNVIFVDYLQLVRVSARDRNRTEEVSSVSRTLHTLAQRHGVLVIALAQLGRPEKDKKSGKLYAPKISDLKESGQIEQDADVVVLLYNVDPEDPQSDRRVKVGKNKEGIVDTFDLAFDGKHQQLVERMKNPYGYKPKPFRGTPVLREAETDPQLSLDAKGGNA